MGGRACVFVRVSAVRVCTVLVRGLGMNGRVCSFVRANAVRMCTVPVMGLGLAAYSLPGGGFLLGLCATFPRVHVRYGVRLGQCEQCILYVCVCSCMAVGVCSSSVVPLVVSTCMRTLYSIWHGGLGGVRSIQGCYLHVCTERAPLEQCSAWLVRAYVLILFVLVPRVYPLYMPVRVMYLLTRACARTALVPSHSVYCIVPLVQCTGEPVFVLVLWLYHCTVCTVLVPLVQWCSVASAGNVSFTRFYTRAVLVLLHSRHG